MTTSTVVLNSSEIYSCTDDLVYSAKEPKVDGGFENGEELSLVIGLKRFARIEALIGHQYRCEVSYEVL